MEGSFPLRFFCCCWLWLVVVSNKDHNTMNLNTAFHWKAVMSFFTGVALLSCIQMEWSFFYIPFLVLGLMVLFMKLAPTSFFETQQRSDEEIFLYPTASYENSDGDITVKVHGSVYHPKREDKMRGMLINMIGKALHLSERTAQEKQYFYDRIHCFLVDNRRGKRLSVALSLPDGSELTHSFGLLTGGDGHASEKIVIAREQCLNAIGVLADRIAIRTIPQDEQEKTFYGFTRIISKTGVSIVSDIDDTIKHTVVGDGKQCIENSFFRKFKPVPGMASLFRDWEERFCAEFHYVSSCPFQMWGFVDEFLREEDFPEGSSTLRKVRWKDRSFLRLLRSPHNHKLLTIEEMLLRFPDRKFIFVGDSGEYDPEIYVELGLRYHRQVRAIFIRRALESPHKKPFVMPKNVLEYDLKKTKKKLRHAAAAANAPSKQSSFVASAPSPSPSASPFSGSFSPSLSPNSDLTDDATEMSDFDLSESSPTPSATRSPPPLLFPPSPLPPSSSSLAPPSPSFPPFLSVPSRSSDELMKTDRGMAEALVHYSHGHLDTEAISSAKAKINEDQEEKENERWNKLREMLPSHILFHVFSDPSEISDYDV